MKNRLITISLLFILVSSIVINPYLLNYRAFNNYKVKSEKQYSDEKFKEEYDDKIKSINSNEDSLNPKSAQGIPYPYTITAGFYTELNYKWEKEYYVHRRYAYRKTKLEVTCGSYYRNYEKKFSIAPYHYETFSGSGSISSFTGLDEVKLRWREYFGRGSDIIHDHTYGGYLDIFTESEWDYRSGALEVWTEPFCVFTNFDVIEDFVNTGDYINIDITVENVHPGGDTVSPLLVYLQYSTNGANWYDISGASWSYSSVIKNSPKVISYSYYVDTISTDLNYYFRAKLQGNGTSSRATSITDSVRVNPSYLFVSEITLVWMDISDTDLLNINEPYTLKAKFHNPTDNDLNIIYGFKLSYEIKEGEFLTFEDNNLGPLIVPNHGDAYFQLSNQILAFSQWGNDDWINLDTGEIYSFICPTKINFYITEDNDGIPGSDEVGLNLHYNIYVTSEKKSTALLLEPVINYIKSGEDASWYIIGIGFTISAICFLLGASKVGFALGTITTALSVMNSMDIANLRDLEKNLKDIIEDPPNMNYEEVFKADPIFFKYPFEYSNNLLKSMYYLNLTLTNLNLYLRGMLISYERYLGAYEDGNQEYMKIQTKAYESNSKEFISYLYNFTESSFFLTNLSLDNFLENDNYTLNETYDLFEEVEPKMKELGGFTPEMVEYLISQGLSELEIEELEMKFLNFNEELALWDSTISDISSDFNDSKELCLDRQEEIIQNVISSFEELEYIADNYPVVKEQSIEANDNRRIGNVIIDPMYQTGKPDDILQFNIKIENEQDTSDTFNLVFSGLEPAWYLLNLPSTITVPSNSIEEIPLIIKLPDNVNANPDTYELTCTITSSNNPTIFNIVSNFYVKILTVYDIKVDGITISNEIDPWLYPGEKNTYSVLVENTGNIAGEFNLNTIFSTIDINISNYDSIQNDWVTTNLIDNKIYLEPGETKEIFIDIEVPDDWFSRHDVIYTFTAKIISESWGLKKSIELSLKVLVHHATEVEIIFIIDKVKPGEIAVYKINIKNIGNIIDDSFSIYDMQYLVHGELYKVNIHSIQPEWVSFDKLEDTVDPGEYIQFELKISIPENLLLIEIIPYEFICYIQNLYTGNIYNVTDSLQVEKTLYSSYYYVVWELDELKNYISDNSLNVLKGVVTNKLTKAQEKLLDAYELIKAGKLHTGLVKDKIAKTKIELSEEKVELFYQKSKLSDEDFEYLLSSLRFIRNNIVLLMGLSVGTDLGYNLALTEIDLLDLTDFIEENIEKTDRDSLESVINLATSKLEKAIFDISLDKDTESSLTSAQDALDLAKCEVVCLLTKGKISQELADILLLRINQAQIGLILI